MHLVVWHIAKRAERDAARVEVPADDEGRVALGASRLEYQDCDAGDQKLTIV